MTLAHLVSHLFVIMRNTSNLSFLVIPFSAAFEAKVQEMSEQGVEEKKKFIEESGVPSVMDKIIVTGYKSTVWIKPI
jgi:ribosome-binding ATPase YchF (GTP1/OBG family)